MSPKDLVPRCPIGEELHARFDEFMFRTNPEDSPMARALTAHGYKVHVHPLKPKYTDSDWLASRVSINGLSIIFRQPTPKDFLICMIERESENKKMVSPLLGVAEIVYFCHHHCLEVSYLAGCIDKFIPQNAPGKLSGSRLIEYYQRTLGHIEGYESREGFWIYANMRCKKRFEELPIWQRYLRLKCSFTSPEKTEIPPFAESLVLQKDNAL